MADEEYLSIDPAAGIEEPPPPPPPPPPQDSEYLSTDPAAGIHQAPAPVPERPSAVATEAAQAAIPATPEVNQALGNLGEAAKELGVGMVQGSIPKLTDILFPYTLLPRMATEQIMNIPATVRQVQESEKTPPFSKERFAAGLNVVSQLGMAAGILKGIKGGATPTLRETLFPTKEEVAPLTAATERTVESPLVQQVNKRLTEGEVIPNASKIQEPAPTDGGLRARGELPQLSEGNVEAADARLRSDTGEVPAEARQGTETQPQEVAAEKPPVQAETPPVEGTTEMARVQPQENLQPEPPPATAEAAPPLTPEAPPVQTQPEPSPEFEPPQPVKGSGKFRATYQIDKELGDRMENIGASKESGALMGQYAGDKILSDLNPTQEAELGKYLVSKRLETLNPEHPQVLTPEESARITSDPAIAKALQTYTTEIKPEVEALRKQAGLTEEAAAGKGEEFISLIKKPSPEPTNAAVKQASRLPRKTRFAQKAEGQAGEYDTNLRNILEQSYTEVTRKARVSEFYKAVQRKGLAEPAEGRTRMEFGDLPPELQDQLRAATESEPKKSGLGVNLLQKTQRATTGFALTANPPEIVNHMRRQLDVVSTVPPIGRGLVARLEALVPYIGPRTGAFTRTVADNMSSRENMQILQDIFNAGGGSSRSFKSLYQSKIPGVKQLQNFTHDMLFGIPKGRGIKGWDLRMRVQLEKIRRTAEGNTDPQRIREFANQIGQYGSHPDWFVRGLRTINPYAATTLPMRLTELKQSVGTSGLKSEGVAGSLAKRAETILRGTGGTLIGLAAANYLLSGKWPWENEKGHEFDLNTGQTSNDNKTLYARFRVIAPTLSRPLNTAAIPNLLRESIAKKPDYLAAFMTGLANQGLSLVSGPAQNALLTAMTGKAMYVTRGPGARPEIMDIAKTDTKARETRSLQQLKQAAAGINPLGHIVAGEPYAPEVQGPLKYIEKPIGGTPLVRPFGSVFTQSYEKKQNDRMKPGKL